MTNDTLTLAPVDTTESFLVRHQVAWGFLRQTRYVVACILVGIFYLWLSARVIPSPNMDGTRALAAGPAVSLVAELTMLGGLVVAVALGTFLTWPDSPHAGFFIAAVGLIFPACHWGSVTMLLALHPAHLAAAYHTLALQNIFWIVYVLFGELISRVIYRLIGSRRWPMYIGLPWPLGFSGSGVVEPPAPYPAYAGILAHDNPENRAGSALVPQNLMSFFCTCAVALFVLFLLLKSQQPGQAIFACFTAFFAGAFAAAFIAPLADVWTIWIAAPCIAAAGGFLAGFFPEPYPAHAGLCLIRALPIYYLSAGIAGAIMGYYAALRMHTRHAMESENFNPSPANPRRN